MYKQLFRIMPWTCRCIASAALLVANGITLADDKLQSPAITFSQLTQTPLSSTTTDIGQTFFTENFVTSRQPYVEYSNEILFYRLIHGNPASSFYKLTGSTACGSVNGYDRDNLPVTFFLSYIVDGKLWKIDEVHIAYWEDESMFPEEALCPRQLSSTASDQAFGAASSQ